MLRGDYGRLFLSRPWAGLVIAGAVAVAGLVLAGVAWPVGIVLLVLSGLLGLGALVSLWRISRAEPPPGRLYSVAGVSVHLLAEGEAADARPVIWVAGGHGEGLIMHHLHRTMREETRSILFDRTGSGWTGPARGAVTITGETRQLKAALEQAGERGPFVLAGHSFGGLFCANFAHRYPELVAGVVLLDSTPPWNVAFAGALSLGLVIRKAWWGALASHFGLHRLVEPEIDDPDSDLARELADVAETVNWHSVQPKSLLAEASVFRNTIANPFELVIGKGALGDLPLVLMAQNPSPKEMQEMRVQLGKKLGLSEIQVQNLFDGLRDSNDQQVALSRKGRLVTMPEGSSHMFPYEHPGVVLDEVRKMVHGEQA
jgi:pimeloyl-ACP methyl ester carboxylesterase